jgi:hypothetical protein
MNTTLCVYQQNFPSDQKPISGCEEGLKTLFYGTEDGCRGLVRKHQQRLGPSPYVYLVTWSKILLMQQVI